MRSVIKETTDDLFFTPSAIAIGCEIDGKVMNTLGFFARHHSAKPYIAEITEWENRLSDIEWKIRFEIARHFLL